MSRSVFGKRLASLRKKRGLNQTQLANIIGMSHSTVASWETGTRDPSTDMVRKLAEFFDVSIDYLLGQSLWSIIEKRLSELGMSVTDLANVTELPEGFIRGVDTLPPEPWDYEQGEWIDKLAKALRMNSRELKVAFARQEPPGYEGPALSPEEAFKELEKDFENEDFPTLAEKFDNRYDTKALKEEVAIRENIDEVSRYHAQKEKSANGADENEGYQEFLNELKKIADQHDYDLKDPEFLDLLNKALGFVRSVRGDKTD